MMEHRQNAPIASGQAIGKLVYGYGGPRAMKLRGFVERRTRNRQPIVCPAKTLKLFYQNNCRNVAMNFNENLVFSRRYFI